MRNRLVYLVMTAAALVACGVATHNPAMVAANAPPQHLGADTLKVHMRSGELYMLRSWALDSSSRELKGHGTRYTLLRAPMDSTQFTIALDSVALFETNTPGAAYPLGMQGVAVLTTLGAYASAICLADPKSCFGSCPTFYLEGDSTHRVHAEGFSASVASVLEARDLDAMPRASVRGTSVGVRMKNEAWETHVVRAVNLLVAPRNEGRVFAGSDGRFYAAASVTAASSCSGSEGDCLSRLAALDGVERRSAADSSDLAAREILELTFAGTPRRAGVVLTARNSLITTFLFYQSMAYVGANMGATVASFERGGRGFAEAHFGMARLLGVIEVEALVNGHWVAAGGFGEPGPIAADTKVIPLPRGASADGVTRVRLRMAKGNWRLDWAGLAELGDTVAPVRLAPTVVERGGRADAAALASLRDGSRPLVTMPGDEYVMRYELPAPAESLELFLESRGYYYEWQRAEWIGEQDPVMAAMVLAAPAELLRRLAPAYKRGESRMEELFWASRYNAGQGGPDARR